MFITTVLTTTIDDSEVQRIKAGINRFCNKLDLSFKFQTEGSEHIITVSGDSYDVMKLVTNIVFIRGIRSVEKEIWDNGEKIHDTK